MFRSTAKSRAVASPHCLQPLPTPSRRAPAVRHKAVVLLRVLLALLRRNLAHDDVEGRQRTHRDTKSQRQRTHRGTTVTATAHAAPAAAAVQTLKAGKVLECRGQAGKQDGRRTGQSREDFSRSGRETASSILRGFWHWGSSDQPLNPKPHTLYPKPQTSSILRGFLLWSSSYRRASATTRSSDFLRKKGFLPAQREGREETGRWGRERERGREKWGWGRKSEERRERACGSASACVHARARAAQERERARASERESARARERERERGRQKERERC